jgi:hypothetical protein
MNCGHCGKALDDYSLQSKRRCYQCKTPICTDTDCRINTILYGCGPYPAAKPSPEMPVIDWQTLSPSEAAKARRIERKLTQLRTGRTMMRVAKPKPTPVVAAEPVIEAPAPVVEPPMPIYEHDPYDEKMLLAMDQHERQTIQDFLEYQAKLDSKPTQPKRSEEVDKTIKAIIEDLSRPRIVKRDSAGHLASIE